MSIRITCIKKSNGHHEDPHHAISDLGWINEQTNEAKRSTRLEMYDWIKNHDGVASVLDARGNKARVGVREHANGTKYVQTYADRVWTDNLLALPECR
ncbi:hypothetical protein ACPOL_0519 [Acidisarcina polymorpha]|uniref:DUF3892 domain-containing protein n=1 Tax=Acidisarcina polymorpha TaxID=2211140 RepID=A0A2Z5FTS0_9BACT|nr:DUF3892 domain-containing protein [Acidisarcina polymorpha]AXC09894.1 hypothetical protein ACPOL_0519 [Acidisarcina polymorpha]